MKNSEFVSTIINDLSYLQKDSHISQRHILSIGQINAKFLLAQKMGDRSLFRQKNLFRTIRCFQLHEKDAVECLGVRIPSCEVIMESDKINGLIYGKYGNSIVSVTSVGGKFSFKETSPSEYRSMCKRPFAKHVIKDKEFFYEIDGRIYLPNSSVEAVDVTYIPYDESMVNQQSSCSKDCDKCKSIWDYEFMCTDELLSSVQKATLQEISGEKGIIKDSNPNLDSNIKTKTIN